MSSQTRLHQFDVIKFLPESPQATTNKAVQTAWERWEMASFGQNGDVVATASSASSASTSSPAGHFNALLSGLDQSVPVLQIDEAELAELRHEAQQAGQAEGHAQGLIEGRAAGLAEVQAQAAQLQDLALALPAALQLAQHGVADDLLALALDIARQVLGQALAAQPHAILSVVQELLHAEPSLSGSPQLLLHPDDAALVKELLADDLKAAGWRVRHDAQIERGGCRVTAHSGERDATVQARWERVSAALARQPVAGNLLVSESAESIDAA